MLENPQGFDGLPVRVTVSNHAARAGVAADLLASKGFKVAGAIGV